MVGREGGREMKGDRTAEYPGFWHGEIAPCEVGFGWLGVGLSENYRCKLVLAKKVRSVKENRYNSIIFQDNDN